MSAVRGEGDCYFLIDPTRRLVALVPNGPRGDGEIDLNQERWDAVADALRALAADQQQLRQDLTEQITRLVDGLDRLLLPEDTPTDGG